MFRGQRRRNLHGWGWTALLAVAISILVITPARAFQLEAADTGANVRWYVPEVALQLDPELEEFFADLPLMRLMREAAAAWSGFGAPTLQFVAGTPSAPGFDDEQNVNGVYLAHDWKFEPDALATTVATYESKTGHLIDADVFINANFQFAWVAADGQDKQHYDLLGVMTHELGHVLGLADSMSVPEATMSPYFKRGDTHQRDLADDDEQGIAHNYDEASVDDAVSEAGCGGASVLRRSAEAPTERDQVVAVLGVMLALWLWSRTRRARYTLVFGGVLLFGLAPAARSTLGDAQVPAHRLARDHPEARQRMAAFTRGAERLIEGRAAYQGSYRRDGLIWTRFVVRGADGEVALELPGGAHEGVTQVVSGHALPADGDQLLIAQRARGPHAWARLRDGLAFAGTLGAGPALRWR
jgi:hypothetical protein